MFVSAAVAQKVVSAIPRGTWLVANPTTALISKNPRADLLRISLRVAPVLPAWLMMGVLSLGLITPVWGQPNGVFREIYDGLSGSSLQALTNNSSFPNFPAAVEILTNVFESPRNFGDYYGERLRALVVPPLTGTYVFWISADDTGALFLSSDESAANKFQIGFVTNALYRSWYSQATQQSTNVFLEAGRRYYLEALHSAGTGDDSLSVGWKLPGGALEQPIPDARLRPLGMVATTAPLITSSPSDLIVLENEPAVFRVGVSNLDAVNFQWRRNGVNLGGALGASYTLPQVGLNDHGARFDCVVSNAVGNRTSAEATLTVLADSTPPLLISVANLNSNAVQVDFSEAVEPASATNLSNYSMNNGISVTAASFGASARTMHLTTSPLLRGASYTLTVSNVRDRAAAHNPITPNSQRTFPALLKGIYREVFTDIPGSDVSDLTNHPAFPANPSSADLITNLFETPTRRWNNFGQRLRARVVPPVTGNYTFWIAADDSAVLLLGTDDTPASARPIASVSADVSVAPRQWDVQPSQKSAAVPLQAGQQYYIEALMQSSISIELPPDHLAVRWQLPDGSLEEPIPIARLTPSGMSPPLLTAQPTNTTLVQGSAAFFLVSVSNPDPIHFQWQQNGLNIPGATNQSYTEPAVALAENGSVIRCVLWNALGSTNTAGAILTVTPDVTSPFLLAAYNSGSNRVVVFFSEPVDAASATNVVNYRIGGVTISAASLRDSHSVNLTTTPLVLGGAYTLTVNGVRDRATPANSIAPNSQRTLLAADFFPQDIGAPARPGALAFVANGVDITASGGDLGGTNDQFHFSYEARRGDFDVKVRVQQLDFADAWTVAGLMAREDLGTNSRYAAIFSTPSIAGTFFESRTNLGAAAQRSGNFPVNYPATWLRLQRVGGTRFNGYASLDGQTWTQLGSVILALPSSIYLGFAVSSHIPSQTVLAQFREFGDSNGESLGALPAATEPLGPSNRRTGLAFTEIMYHPAPRADERSLEFLELFNSNPFFEDISGYRISGDVDFTFPPGTVLPGGGFLVIARNPADLQAVYGIANVTGPYDKNLSNGKGTVRLRNRAEAILLEVNYESKPPWPVAADGTGHSLVLARPSYGENHVQAWGPSGSVGGSPGRVDGVQFDPRGNVVINEFLAHTDLPEVDYIELYNHSLRPVDVSGCWLSDDPGTNKFRIPDGTVLGPTGLVAFAEATLGFALSASGEAIYFWNSNQTRVLDAITFAGQENGVSTGRYPDGAPTWRRLSSKTPGAPNPPPRLRNIVINEIMYHPITDDDNDEFIELYNRSSSAINLNGWRFTDGIDFTFTNVTMAAAGYLVVARNAAHLRTNYSNLNAGNTVGNYSGTLKNSGERLALSRPDFTVTTNLDGVVKTNFFDVVVEEVTFAKGGRWGAWSDGGGSSLELVDPRADGSLPSNWADSDETAKSAWTTLSASGTLDNADGSGSLNNSLQIYLLDQGECLLDNVSLSIGASANLVTNADFESSSINNWVFQGDHMFSRIEGPGFSSSKSLHLVAHNRGDPVANRVFTLLNQRYSTNATGTISAKVKWLHGRPEILLRLRGNQLDLPGVMTVPRNLGTPGARNSRSASNGGPAITEVRHTPVLPAANQPVVVTARVQDPDGLASVQLVYRLDPSGPPALVTMVDDGTAGDAVPHDGIYAGTIPGQANDALIAFYVQATDGFSTGATLRFPADAPTHECLVHFGDAQPFGAYGTYRFWLTRASYNQWLGNPKLSNEGNPGTFVYGNFRVIYNATDRFGGSPFHADLLDTPDGTNCDYYVEVPSDDRFLDATSFTLQTPGNFGRDATGQNEQTAYWMAREMALPYLYRRPVNVFFNGLHRSFIYEDTQQPASDYDAEFFPSDVEGDLYKVQYDFETTDDTVGHSTTPASLRIFTTTGGGKKLERYRQTFTKRAVDGSPYDYTHLLDLVDLMNTLATGDDYIAQVFPAVDLKEWMEVFALERLWNNSDLYGNQKQSGNPGGQNCYIYKPDGDAWKFLMWDVDFCFSSLPTDYLFNFTDPPLSNLCAQPLVLRMYWQALEDAATGPWAPAKVFPGIDDRYQSYLASGIAAGPPTAMKNFISARRDYVLWLIAQVRADFAVTSPGGNSFTSSSTLVTLAGTAPISARVITINGIEYPLSWSSITQWSVQLPLTAPTNNFVLQPLDAQGNPLPNATRHVTVLFNGPISRPEDSLVINEIMYRPAVSNASYVEIYNRSANTWFSLFNYRLHGVDFNFSPHTLLGPQSFLVVTKDSAAFQAAYGTGARIAGEFKGNLDPDGETLTLLRQPLTTNEAEVIIDQVKYEAAAPWPSGPAAPNSGIALQLIDPAADNARVSNWDDGSGWRFFSSSGIPGGTRLCLYLDGVGDVFLDDVSLVAGTVAGVGPNYLRDGDFETALSSAWSFLGSSGANTSTTTNSTAHSGSSSLHMIFTRTGDPSHCLYQDVTGINTANTYTLSFWYRPTTNANLLSVWTGGGAFSPVLSLRPVPATPGAPNSVLGSVTPYPLLWINEVQPNNPNGLTDNTGTPQPWIELFNQGSDPITLDGFFLANTYANLQQWAFPAGTLLRPGEFRVIFVDGQPQLSAGSVWHTSFRLDPARGSIVLSRGRQILDYINYTNMEAGVSYGSWPDGQLFARQLFYYVTPAASNNPAPVPVSINEWMASNTRTLLNPARNRYDDWFELCNFGTRRVNLSGFYLTDDLNNKNKWRIPNGTTIEPRSFLLCWADNDTTGTNRLGDALHTSFQLSKSSDEIGLFSPEGLPVDAVVFGAQGSDVSQGRYPDANVGGVYFFMPEPTPRTNNVIVHNLFAPVLQAIPDYSVDEGATLTLTVSATDADVPAQALTYSLLAGAPEGAEIDPRTGVLTWTPLESQGGVNYSLTVKVTDNGSPLLSDSTTFHVTVNEVNSPPAIGPIARLTIDPGARLSVLVPAADADLPPQTLSYALLTPPAGASVNSSGLITWTPTGAQASTTNLLVVTVSDHGTPSLSATQSFTVIVTAGSVCSGIMGDVSPRLTGNGAVSISDWVQVGRFASGLNDVSNSCELAKADCAPKPCGNGSITIADWVQAGRYAGGVDPLVSICDAPGPALLPLLPGQSPPLSPTNDVAAQVARTLFLTNLVMEHGETNCLQVFLNAQGDENALGFSVSFETNLLTFVSANLGSGVSSANLNVNRNQLSQGRIGLALALAVEQTLPAGRQGVAELCFRAAAGSESVVTSVTMVDQPILREVVDAFANTLPAGYLNGSVFITGGVTFDTITVLGASRVRLRMIGPPGRSLQLQRSSDLAHWVDITQIANPSGVVEYTDTVPTGVNQHFYRAVMP